MLSEIALSCKAVDTTLESCDHSKAAVCCRVTVNHAVRDGTKFSGSKQNYFHMILFDMLQDLVSIFHSVDMATLFLNLNLKFARCKLLHKVICTAYNAP